MIHGLRRTARLAVPILLLAVLAVRLGGEPFRQAAHVVSVLPMTAALLLGLVATSAQALRWRTVVRALTPTDDLGVRAAVREYYRAGFLNVALPGGMGGDAVRVWRRRTVSPSRGMRTAAHAVVVERLVGTAVLFALAGGAAAGLDRRLTAMLLTVAAVTAVAAAPALCRMPWRALVAVLGWTVLATAALVGMVTVGMVTVGVEALGAMPERRQMLLLALLLLAAAAIPLGVAGFGPREAGAAVIFAAAGLPPTAGVAVATAVGVLSVVSVLPGAVVLLGSGRGRVPASGQIELDADVLAQDEASGGGAQRVLEPVRSREPQPGHAIPDQQWRGGDEQTIDGMFGDEPGHRRTSSLDEHPAQTTARECVEDGVR